MKTYTQKTWPFYFLILSLLSLSQCRKQVTPQHQQNLDSFRNYISGIQAGPVTKSQGVKVYLATGAGEMAVPGQELAADVIKVDPAPKGAWVWENEYTIHFQPAAGVKESGQTHQAVLDLGKIYQGVPDSLRQFYFHFEFLPVKCELDWGFLRPDPEDNQKMILAAKMRASEELDSTLLPEFFKVSGPGGAILKPQFTREGDGSWNVLFKGIPRGESAAEWTVNWYADPETGKEKREKKWEVPGKGDFVVTGAETDESEGRIVKVYFSDPLDPAQDLRAFVQLSPVEVQADIRPSGDAVFIVIQTASADAPVSLSVLDGLKSGSGKTLKSAFRYDVLGKEQKPKVRMKSPGSILPMADKLILPFEAINLKKVDVEIFKLFSSNVLFNLHMDYSQDLYNLVKLGRVVHQQTIELDKSESGENKRTWRSYGLDLTKMIKPEPGAFYEVRICFRPEYSDYACTNKKFNLRSDEADQLSGSDEFTSVWNQWGYYEYDSEDGERCWNADDPCCPYYYSARNFGRRMVMASNLALIAKKSDQFGAHYIFVRDILKGGPVAGAEVKFFDAQLQLVHTAQTDAAGKLMYDTRSKISIVMAQHKGQYAYLKLDMGRNLPLSEFDVNGLSSQSGMKTFLYAERGIWRPGDTILMGAILNQSDKPIPSGFPVTLQIKNPSGKTVFQQVYNNPVFGHYAFQVPTRPDYITGSYTAVLKVGSIMVEKNLRIETVKPNRYKIEFDAASVLPPSDGWPEIQCKASFLHGAPASGRKISIDMIYTPLEPRFDAFPSFSFINPEYGSQSGTENVLDQELDEKGSASFSYQLDKSTLQQDLHITLQSHVIEEGEVSTDYFEHDARIFKEYLGIKKQDSDFGDYFPAKQPIKFQAVAVDHKGKGMAGRKLKAEVFLVDGQWWYEVRNNYSYVSQSAQRKPVKTIQLVTDASGQASFHFTPEEYDRYFIRISGANTLHTCGTAFYSGWSYDGDDADRGEFIQVLRLKTEKEKYQIGEQAAIQLPGAASGSYLIHLVKDNKILRSENVPASKSKTEFRFAVTKGMEPNLYLDISLIQPVEGQNQDLPVRMFGVVPVQIENPERRLEPVLASAASFKPGAKAEVEIREKNGREMSYQLFLVEEGLLGLTRFKSPDPYAHFFQKESMTLYTWDNYGQIIGSGNGLFQGIYSIGGDQDIDPAQLAKMKRFKPLAFTTRVQKLAKGATARHTFDLPNYNGAVRLMIVAGNESAYGSAEKSVPVKAELMSDILFPRVLSIRDQLSVPVSITVTDEKVREVKCSLIADGAVSISGPSVKTLKFDRPGEKKIFFDVSGKTKLGAAGLKLVAESGSFRSESKVDFYLDNPNPVSRKVQSHWVEPGKTVNLSIEAFGMSGTRSVELSASTFAGKSLEEMKDELVRYPHGCAEQVTSAAFAQIRLENLMDLDATARAEIRNNVIQGISKLQRFQKSSGGFSYWDQESEVADYVSSYVGHFLLEARKAGFAVPEEMLSRWKEYQQARSRSYESRKSEYGSYLEYNQAYRLYTLALAGSPDWTAMNQLTMRKDRSAMSSWVLAAAYALGGKNDLATKLWTGLPDQIQPYSESFWNYGSDIRDEAMIALVLHHLNRNQEAAALIRKVFNKVSSGSYLSTQEMAILLVTSSKIWQKSANGSSGMEFSYTWASKKKDVKTGYSVFSTGMEEVEKSDFSFTNRSAVPVAVQLVQTGKPETQSAVNESNILQMQVSYTDELNRSLSLSAIPQSTRLIARVKITHNGAAGHLRNLALTAAFPACFEINNQRIGGINVQNPKVRNTDFRDDRVMYYFDLGVRETLELAIPLVATTAGTFQSPDLYAEAMYEPSVRARVNKGAVKVLANTSE